MKLTPRAEDAYNLQSYQGGAPIQGVEIVELRRFNDDAGSMTELGRLQAGKLAGVDGFEAAQINFSTLEPGAIKAFHLHRRQTDVWYVPPSDRIMLVLSDQREGSPTAEATMRLMIGDGRSRLVRIPPGVAHGCRNMGTSTASIIYFCDVQFSPEPESCDEGRLPWDFLGSDIWDMSRE